MRKAKPPSRSVGYCTYLPQRSAEWTPSWAMVVAFATPQIGFSPKTKTSKLGMKNTPASIHWPNNEMMCVYLLNMRKSNWVCLKMGCPKLNELPFSTIKHHKTANLGECPPETRAPCAVHHCVPERSEGSEFSKDTSNCGVWGAIWVVYFKWGPQFQLVTYILRILRFDI